MKLASGKGSFPGAGSKESNLFGLLLILADNYKLTTNDPTTEAQSAQRTHRDFLVSLRDCLKLAGPCGAAGRSGRNHGFTWGREAAKFRLSISALTDDAWALALLARLRCGWRPDGPRLRPSPLTGTAARMRAGARRSARPRLCHGAQVAGDAGGLVRGPWD